MKDHPDYKYRPRRKPKTLKKDGYPYSIPYPAVSMDPLRGGAFSPPSALVALGDFYFDSFFFRALLIGCEAGRGEGVISYNSAIRILPSKIIGLIFKYPKGKFRKYRRCIITIHKYSIYTRISFHSYMSYCSALLKLIE